MNKSETLSLQDYTIVKRNGTLVPLRVERIGLAIEAAFRDTKKIPHDEHLPDEIMQMVKKITDLVIEEAVQRASQGSILTVEKIQDLVEVKLMEKGHHDVARDYISYRDQHKTVRSDSPQNLKVLRRDGISFVRFNPMKIAFAIERGFRDTLKIVGPTTENVIEAVNSLTNLVVGNVMGRATKGEVLTIELIQNEVEKHLMEKGYHDVARDYILFRAQRTVNRSTEEVKVKEKKEEPDYTYVVAANLLLDKLYRETMEIPATHEKLGEITPKYFKEYVKIAVDYGLLNPELLEFDLEKLAQALDIQRDRSITFFGLQTLYNHYFLHHDEQRLETPQIFWMRVAMGLALKEGEQKEERAIEFYNVMSNFLFVPSTTTLFNSGTCHSQLSSCYLSTVKDDLVHIFKVISDDARLSKWAGGLGNDWTNVRATGARIKGTNGKSQGVIPFLKVANDTAVAVNQGSRRQGAMCAYLETWHLDIEDFLELRKNTGDERRRTHDMSTANWVPDLFMKRVTENQSWMLFSPSDVPDLHDLYGQAFEKRYAEYEKMAECGEIKLFKKVDANSLWRKMLGMLFETGHPWITFKDPSNIRSPQDHAGVIHNSSLGTEILLNTSEEETGVCNLGSINLPAHVIDGDIDRKQLATTIQTGLRMLDNVIDVNFYPTKEAERANSRHRPVGLGMMGFQDALYKMNISYASNGAVAFADHSMELISYYALLSSSELAGERGAYSSYEGSKWDRGILPIDSLALLAEERGGELLEMNSDSQLDWTPVRDSIKKCGLRNSNTMAIAPTATIANIVGITQSVEPMYKHLFVKSNLSGEFTTINPYLVAKLKEQNLWDSDMIDDLKYFDGSILEIDRIPSEIKQIFPTAFEIEPEWLIECASRRQKWIDMGQSLNLYLSNPSGKKLHHMYLLAWKKGLKTTYYLRSRKKS